MKHKQTQHVANACHKGDVCSIQLGGIDTSPPGIFLGLGGSDTFWVQIQKLDKNIC